MTYTTMLERFVRYTKVNTRSDINNSSVIPSTPEQTEFLFELVEELKEIGFEGVAFDERDAYVTAKLSSNLPEGKKVPAIGFIAHVDTADYPSENIQPQVHENYNGEDVVLNHEQQLVMRVEEFPNLKNYVGETLITTDGTTLLGADDKAGLVSIIEAFKHLISNPEIEHGEIWVAFGPDEEIGFGAHRFEIDKFPVEFAYTLDSGVVGKLENETFNAALATLTFTGTSVHPGMAKNVMVNALAEAAKFFQKLPTNEVAEKTSGYEGYYMLTKQEGNLDFVQCSYNIRDHDRAKFETRKKNFKRWVDEQNASYDHPRIKLEMYDQYYNMKDVLDKDPRALALAIEAYKACGIEPDLQPFRGGTDGCIISYKGIPTPNLFTGAENLHGCYEFVTLESMQKGADVVLEIIQRVPEKNN